EITSHAKQRFLQREWHGQREAVRKRISLHERVFENAVRELSVSRRLGKGWWKQTGAEFEKLTGSDTLAKTFFDAVGRMLFQGDLAFTLFNSTTPEKDIEPDLISISYQAFRQTCFASVLQKIDFEISDQNLIATSSKLLEKMNSLIPDPSTLLFFYPHLFYRNKHAYLLGYGTTDGRIQPLLFAFTNSENGIVLNALLATEEELKNIFAFSRSYFLVEARDPKGLVELLLKVMPSKPEAQLFMNLGYQEHGKELVVAKLHQHLQHHRSQFMVAPGIPGMVMMVFTLPDYDLVFKIIRDHFKPPKSVTRQEVIEKYLFIAKHDRVGRLADAQRFEYLGLPLAYFDQQLLDFLLLDCSQSVSIRQGIVCFQDVYVERKMIPLNIYLEQASADKVEHAVNDFGNAIREMAMSNIFPGDLLIKNFGVTLEERVVFYDYDEIVPLVDCTFKDIPKARDDDEEMSAEPWYAVNENDIFPQELVKFLLPAGPLRDRFAIDHQELYTATFWNRLKSLHQNGEVVDIQPYVANLV
ncbi:MAG: bifunctional isocitrate dehydrogenase kinase/phosphatase, partial [Cytophagales bacterium]|nr:bifunctional isocitrate dehydrogenase kinase/phosphatase [Cytophagales bacterium]